MTSLTGLPMLRLFSRRSTISRISLQNNAPAFILKLKGVPER